MSASQGRRRSCRQVRAHHLSSPPRSPRKEKLLDNSRTVTDADMQQYERQNHACAIITYRSLETAKLLTSRAATLVLMHHITHSS